MSTRPVQTQTRTNTMQAALVISVLALLVLLAVEGSSVDAVAQQETGAAPGPVSPEQQAWEAQVPEDLREYAGFRFVKEDPALPRVLLIGDSISIGYTPEVQKRLAGKANVLRIPVNGGATKRGVEEVSKWLGEKKWDVIYFNFGLHDLKRLVNGKMDVAGDNQTSLEDYEKNLETIVALLQKTGAKLIWASTTPVPDGAGGRLRGDDVKYNAVAAKVMQKHGIPIDDLYSIVLPELEKYQLPENVHFKEEGSEFLGEQVARVIDEALKAPKPKP